MRKWLLCTVLLLLATTLVAKDAVLRVGYISSVSVEAVEEVVLSAAESVLSVHPDLTSLAKARLDRADEKAYQRKVHEALKADDHSTVERKVESGIVSDVEFIRLDVQEMQEGEAEHLIRVNELDVLLVLSGSLDGPLLEYALSLYTLEDSVTLVDTLAVLHEVEAERELILRALSSYFLPEYSYIKLNDRPSNLVAYVDGVKARITDSLIFVTPGVHTLSFSSINKIAQDAEVETENGEIKSIDLSFAPITFPSLEIVTVPMDAEINVQGMDGVVGHYYSSAQSLPFALHAQREGFADLNLQINTPLLASTLELRPKWMDNDSRMKDAKDEMYRALRNTILSFASYVLVSSFDNIYPTEFKPYSAPLRLTCSSISIISLLDFLYKSGKYYHTAEQTYY